MQDQWDDFCANRNNVETKLSQKIMINIIHTLATTVSYLESYS